MRFSLSILSDERVQHEGECCGYKHGGEAFTITHSTPLKVSQNRLLTLHALGRVLIPGWETQNHVRDESCSIINGINSDTGSWYQIETTFWDFLWLSDAEYFEQSYPCNTNLLNASQLTGRSSDIT